MRTLPPPEWGNREGPRSAATLQLEVLTLDAPTPRRTGPRAELAFHRARVRACRLSGDGDGERQASAALARALVARGTELDEAIKLARHALLLGDDPLLREELSQWLSVLGESALAAQTLESLPTGTGAGARLTRMGVLFGRAGMAGRAADAFFDAARSEPTDAVAPELLGSLGTWAPGEVSPARAAEAYLEGARRREKDGDRAGAFEDLLRAFEVAPTEPVPAQRLAHVLRARGRAAAADEVLREHARASGDRGRAVHLARLRAALEADDVPAALGAALDAGLDGETGATRFTDEADSHTRAFHRVLERAGLNEVLAAHLELCAPALPALERHDAFAALGRLYDGALSSPERAVDAWSAALLARPDSDEARGSLLEHASGRIDPWLIAEGLILAVAENPACEGTRRLAADLALLAEGSLDAPRLALWALERADVDAAELAARRARLLPRAEADESAIAGLAAALAERSGDERRSTLEELAALLLEDPAAAPQLESALEELVALAPERVELQERLRRSLGRGGRGVELEAHLRRLLAEVPPGLSEETLRVELARARALRGDLVDAFEWLEPLLRDTGTHSRGLSLALLLAARRDDPVQRARSLLRLAAPLTASLRAVLCAVAAEALLDAGDVEGASDAAEQARRADPTQPRPVALLAQVALRQSPSRKSAEALERALGVIVPRGPLCEALAEAHEALGDAPMALVWTQRWLALRPGDPRAARTLLGRVTESGDALRLSDAMSWLLSQPQPVAEMSPLLGALLLRLAELDPARAAGIARRALDVLGPRVSELTDAVLSVADAASEPGLALTVLERRLATAPSAERSGLLVELIRRRRLASDVDGAGRALARYAKQPGETPELEVLLESAPLPRSGDGDLALLEARAEAGLRAVPLDALESAQRFRELGAGLWDLAGDVEGAVSAWERAAGLDGERGLTRFARDLLSFAGQAEALVRLQAYAKRQEDPRQASKGYAVAAMVALGAGESRAALSLAEAALDLDASRADVLAIAERAASSADGETLERIYERLANAALGCYGERAVHYRAARLFERREEPLRALGHAVRAFEAVPGEGVTFVVMTRLAARTGQATEVVRALERIATTEARPHARAEWLRRAAGLSGAGAEGARQRVDVLLRALAVEPDRATLESLGAAARELVASSPEARETVELRVRRAIEVLLSRVDGPEGARAGVASAALALDLLGDADFAFDALDRAISSDADVDEYRDLVPRAPDFARLEARARGWVERVVQMSSDRYANSGRALLEFAAELGALLDEPRSRAVLLVAAAERDPDDTDLVRRATVAAEEAGETEALSRVVSVVPSAARIASLLESARAAESSGDISNALEFFEHVRDDTESSESERSLARERLRELYARAGRRDALESLLVGDLEREGLTPEERAKTARDLAALVAARGAPERALTILSRMASTLGDHAGLLADMETLARQAGDKHARADALGRLVPLLPGAERLNMLRELAGLLEELGDAHGALARHREVLEADPRDLAAISALERDAERRSDWDALIELMARRAAHAARVDEVRRIRLRRASVLEQRLGRAQDAMRELEALVAATGDHHAVLRVLADLHQRLGAPARAAQLWMRASACTTDRREAADAVLKAARAELAAGDAAAARRVLEGLEAWAEPTAEVLALRVELERRDGDPASLATALDEYASLSPGTSPERGALLLEAARAFDALGELEEAALRAQRAALLAPESAEAQLMARRLEYRMRGPGDATEARVTVAELRVLDATQLNPEQLELRTFLLAEALDVALGAGAGLRELTAARTSLGLRPLIAVGLAERSAASGELRTALEAFDAALSGDLQDLRSRGELALSAARAARDAGESGRASSWVELALADEATRTRALELQTALLGDRRLIREGVLSERSSESSPRLRALRPSVRPPPKPGAPGPAARGAVPVVVEQRADDAIAHDARAEPDDVVVAPASEAGVGAQTQRSVSSHPEPKARPSSAPPPPPRVSRIMPAVSETEERLVEELQGGSLDAGLELMEQLERREARSHDLVAVARRVVALAPSEPGLLRRLHRAAAADRDPAYARAIEHVLHAVDPSAAPVDPPALADQPENPEAVRALLFRDVVAPGCEALALVWEGATHVFRRDPSTYGVTGLERVPFGAPTALGRTYSSVARSLGLGRTPVYQRRSTGPITLSVALLSTPAVVLAGDVTRESLALGYHLAMMLSAALPEHVLLFGAPEAQTRGVLRALGLTFGSPATKDPSLLSSVAHLAEVLWESIPTRSQRRLRELCEDARTTDFDAVMSSARRAVRRAGLFACGDLPTALREVALEEGLPPLSSPEGVRKAVAGSDALADLFRLATSAEYAHIRWRAGRGPGWPGTP